MVLYEEKNMTFQTQKNKHFYAQSILN